MLAGAFRTSVVATNEKEREEQAAKTPQAKDPKLEAESQAAVDRIDAFIKKRDR